MVETLRVVYSGIFLGAASKARLIRWWEHTFGELQEVVYCNHLTLMFKPSMEEVRGLPLGEEYLLRVTSMGSNDRVQAVGFARAQNNKILEACNNIIPHITVSTSKEGKPVESNGLPFYRIDDGIELLGRVGIFTNQGVKYSIED